MTHNKTRGEQFWDAVVCQDYETVRKAIADGFDVNAKIPGKVDPITFAQPAEDMVMLKILWEAGAHPATPWLEAVFADFASGGDGSEFRHRKSQPVGRLILHRFNGDEEFALEDAVIHIEHHKDKFRLTLEAMTHETAVKSLPDTKELRAKPRAQISVSVTASEAGNLAGLRLSVPISYDGQIQDYSATICYVEHEPLEANEIEFVSKEKDKYLVRWTGLTADVNYYDGSKPNTRVEIEGWFTLKPTGT